MFIFTTSPGCKLICLRNAKRSVFCCQMSPKNATLRLPWQLMSSGQLITVCHGLVHMGHDTRSRIPETGVHMTESEIMIYRVSPFIFYFC